MTRTQFREQRSVASGEQQYAAALSIFVACADADDRAEGTSWSSFGRDLANTRHARAEPRASAANVARLTQAWAFAGAEHTATPVVVDEVAYVGDWTGTLRAFDVASGQALWQSQVSATVSDETAPRAITSSVAVVGERVYVADMAASVHALERDGGAIVWSTRVDEHATANCQSSPLVVDDRVIIGVASHEVSLIQSDYTFRGSVVALDAATGAIAWRFWVAGNDATSGAGGSVWSSAAADRALGLAFIGTGQSYEAPAGPYTDALLALDIRSGALVWSRQFTLGDVYTGLQPPPQGPDADIGGAPNLFRSRGRDVVGVGDKAGVYAVFERASGEPVWTKNVGPGSHLGGIMVAAAVADDRILVTTNLWPDGLDVTKPFLPDFDDPRNVASLVALSVDDGAELWRAELPAPVFGAVAVAGEAVFVGDIRGTVHARSLRDGAALWSATLDNRIASGQSFSAGRLFVTYGVSLLEGILGITAGEPGGLVVFAAPAP